MNIGIDARMFGHHTRGIGRYIQKIIEELETIDTENQYTVFLSPQSFNDFQPKNKNFKKVLVPWKWYSISEQLLFPFLIKKYKVDFMHFPHFNVPIFYNKPFIVTIHDLILLRSCQKRATTLGPLKYYFKKFFYRFVISHAIKKSKKIIALTEFGKQDIINEFNTNSEKISIIFQGLTQEKSNEPKIDTDLKLRYNINKPYVIYVGSAYPHKNLKTIISAMDIVRETHDMQLVFVGKKDFFYQRQEQEFPRKYIRYTNYIPDNELALLYKHAHCYAFPSHYEGFGLPPLEAMQNSCPVIAANSSCLPEILQNAALYINPDDSHDLAQKVIELQENQSLRQKLIQNGLELVPQYNWHTTAQQTFTVYRTFHKA